MPKTEVATFGYLKLTNIPFSQWHGVVTDTPRTIGRSPDADITTPRKYARVSRIHAKLWGDVRGCWIEDSGSSLGTFLNGIRLSVQQPAKMEFGDKIRLADTEFELYSSATPLNDEEALKGGSTIGTMIDHLPVRDTLPYQLAISTLTQSELDIVMEMRRGTVELNELGSALHRSPHTVRKQLESIYKKLNVHSRHELLAKIIVNQ